MFRPLVHLIFGAFILIAGGIIPSVTYAVLDETMSGSWYDPTRDGEGIVLEILPDGRQLAYWFTYDIDGNQATYAYSTNGKDWKRLGESFQIRFGRWRGDRLRSS